MSQLSPLAVGKPFRGAGGTAHQGDDAGARHLGQGLTWKPAIIPQPTMPKPGMIESSTRFHMLISEHQRRAPEVLQSAQGRGGQHGVNQDVAYPGKEQVHPLGGACVVQVQIGEDRQQGRALQAHLELAEPVGAEDGTPAFP